MYHGQDEEVPLKGPKVPMMLSFFFVGGNKDTPL